MACYLSKPGGYCYDPSRRKFRKISFLTAGCVYVLCVVLIQCVPLATESGISLIILTPMKILQRNLNKSRFVVCEMRRNVSVVCVCSASNYCDKEQRSASQPEMPGSVASGTHCTKELLLLYTSLICCFYN